MSTRIYRGFFFLSGYMADALHMVQGFRPYVLKQAEAKMDAFMKNCVAGGMTEGDAYSLWLDRRFKVARTQERDVAVDTDFSLSFIPYINDGSGELARLRSPNGGMTEEIMLGICYTENEKWWKHFLRVNDVREFGYWNNADKPRRITAHDWKARGETWERAMDTSEATSTQAFSIELVGPYKPLPKAMRRAYRKKAS